MKIILSTVAVAMLALPSMAQAQSEVVEIIVPVEEVGCSRSVVRATGNDTCGAPVVRTRVGSARGFGRSARSR